MQHASGLCACCLQGYGDPRLERLRQGIGPEDRDTVLLPPRVPPTFPEYTDEAVAQVAKCVGAGSSCAVAGRVPRC